MLTKKPLLLASFVMATMQTMSCKPQSKPEPAGALAKPPGTPATLAGAPAKPAGWTKQATADCPAYPGKAKVELVDVEGGYTASITTTDASSVDRIREHARYVEAASIAGAGTDALQFGGATGDRTANCPVVLDGTVITTADQPGGVIMTIKAKPPGEVAEIRRVAREHAEMLAIMRDAMK